MNKISTVIFDWAGTTIDFGCMAPVQAFIDAFKSYGIEASMAETREPMGFTKIDHIKAMLQMPGISEQFRKRYQRDYQQDDIAKIYQQFESNLFSCLEQYTQTNPFVLETIKALRERNIKIGSTTGYTKKMMEIVSVAAKNNAYQPDCYFCADDVDGFGRPYPFMLFKNLQTLAVATTAEVIKIGDTQSDIQEAKAAGVIAVGVLEGSSEIGLSAEEWSGLNTQQQAQYLQQARYKFFDYGADYVITNFSEIIPLINSINHNR